MRDRLLKARFWVATAATVLAAALLVVSVVSREWIELLTGTDPDGGDGTLEWVVVGVLALVAVISGGVARTEWLRAAGTT